MESSATHHAILIGIDCYKEKPLNGAVQDVQTIKTCIESAFPPASVNVHVLTATPRPGCDSAVPTEDPEHWPTFRNVMDTLKCVTDSGRPGDCVYIHFAGHGARQRPTGKDYNAQSGDLGLALFTANNLDCELLTSRNLAFRLKKMTEEKEMHATVVLDCCFSASLYREADGEIVRCLPYGLVTGEESSLPDTFDPIFRDVSMKDNWILKSENYATLVACSDDQEAKEGLASDGQVHGKLTYYLSKLLQEKHGFDATHGNIYERLRSNFIQNGHDQHPILFGNRRQPFFGNSKATLSTRDINTGAAQIVACSIPDVGFMLQAGCAQGISVGDEFIMSSSGPRTASPIEQQRIDVIKTVVTNVNAFTSSLEVICSTTKQTVHRGLWHAKASLSMRLLQSSVLISSKMADLDKWVAFGKERSLLFVYDSNQSTVFQVPLDEKNKEFEIWNSKGERVTNLPIMFKFQTTIDQVCDVLEHLARYQSVKSLTNPVFSPIFENSFTAYILLHDGRKLDSSQSIHLKEGCSAHLVVENIGRDDIYVFLYNLGPMWQIENAYKTTYEKLSSPIVGGQKKSRLKRKITVEVPALMKQNRHTLCHDMLKIFVTSNPTSFDYLELPRLIDGVGCEKGVTDAGRYGAAIENWTVKGFSITTEVDEVDA